MLAANTTFLYTESGRGASKESLKVAQDFTLIFCATGVKIYERLLEYYLTEARDRWRFEHNGAKNPKCRYLITADDNGDAAVDGEKRGGG